MALKQEKTNLLLSCFYSNTSQIKMLIPQYILYQIIIIIKIKSIARSKAFQRIASFSHLFLIQFSY